MSLKDRIHSFEEDSKILKEIAQHYGESSAQYAVLKRATVALWYVSSQDYEKFDDYMKNVDAELTPEQQAHLSEMGIDLTDIPGR